MCGLVGAAGDLGGWRKDVFTNLLIVDSLRGMHSTGAAMVYRYEKDNPYGLIKKPGGPSNLLTLQDYKDAMNKTAKVLIGHNRFATVGEHSEANAHPFMFDKVIGAHNGTLDQSDRKKLHNFDLYGTDSEALYSHINQFGIESAIDQLTDWNSAYALTWYDKEEDTINFLRNNKRPLVYTYSKDRNTLYWASERLFLEFAAAQAKQELCGDFFMPEPDKHLSWQLPKTLADKFGGPEVTVRKPPLKVAATTVTYTEGRGSGSSTSGGTTTYYYNGQKTQSQHHASHKSGNAAKDYIFRNRKNTKKFRPPYRDTDNHILNKVQFTALVEDGCVLCGCNCQSWGEFIQPFKGAGDSEHSYICESCYNDDDMWSIVSQMI